MYLVHAHLRHSGRGVGMYHRNLEPRQKSFIGGLPGVQLYARTVQAPTNFKIDGLFRRGFFCDEVCTAEHIEIFRKACTTSLAMLFRNFKLPSVSR